MSRVDSSIEMNAPVSTVYNQWTQFEEFPRFMTGVQEVRQLDESRLVWTMEVGGRRREWLVHISRQVPDQVVSWESEDGADHSATVVFKALTPDKTRMDLHFEFEPEFYGLAPADASRLMATQVAADLGRFKQFVEARGAETGAWRGEIIHGEERPVAPLMDSSNAPPEEQLRFNVTPLQ